MTSLVLRTKEKSSLLPTIMTIVATIVGKILPDPRSTAVGAAWREGPSD
jgi:hypothetical protein